MPRVSGMSGLQQAEWALRPRGRGYRYRGSPPRAEGGKGAPHPGAEGGEGARPQGGGWRGSRLGRRVELSTHLAVLLEAAEDGLQHEALL